MAMTKKERAEFDAALERARRLGALRWTSPVEKDVPIPKSHESVTGYLGNPYNGRIDKYWSESVSHGTGERRESKYSGSQGGRALYSTKLLALRAMRYEMEMECAIKLAKVDRMIDEETQ